MQYSMLPLILLLACPFMYALGVAVMHYLHLKSEYKRRRLRNRFAYKADLKYTYPGGCLGMTAALICVPGVTWGCMLSEGHTLGVCLALYGVAFVLGCMLPDYLAAAKEQAEERRKEKELNGEPVMSGSAVRFKPDHLVLPIDKPIFTIVPGKPAQSGPEGAMVWKNRGGTATASLALDQELVSSGATAAAEARRAKAFEKKEVVYLEPGRHVQVLEVEKDYGAVRVALDDGFIGWANTADFVSGGGDL